MPNGHLKTTKDYVIAMSQKLDDFIEKVKEQKQDHAEQHSNDDKRHAREHRVMWVLIIGLPASLVTAFTLIQIFGG